MNPQTSPAARRAEPVDDLWTSGSRRWTTASLSPDRCGWRVTLVATCEPMGMSAGQPSPL